MIASSALGQHSPDTRAISIATESALRFETRPPIPMRNLVLPPAAVDIVPGPIVLYSEIDARRAVAQAPIIIRPDHDNVVATLTITNPQLLCARSCLLIITHHVKSHRTGKLKTAGSWQLRLPVVGTDERHVFRLTWPTEDSNGNGHAEPQPQ